jgi:hypothetical protein
MRAIPICGLERFSPILTLGWPERRHNSRVGQIVRSPLPPFPYGCELLPESANIG